MRAVWTSTAIAAALIAAAGVTTVTVASTAGQSAAGPEKVADFQLTDTSRMGHELYYFKYAPAIVIMSQTDGTPMSRAAAAELAKLQDAYKDRGVLFYMINSNASLNRARACVGLIGNE